MEQETDIVDRLRRPAYEEHDGQRLVLSANVTEADMAEAADEIERLRKEIGGTTICPSCKAEFLPVMGQERGNACSHPNAEYDSSGAFCPDCKATGTFSGMG